MKIRTIMAAAATGILLTAAAAALHGVLTGLVPEDMLTVQTTNTAGAMKHGDCEGHWSEDGDWVCPDGNHGRRSSSDTSGYGCHSGNSHHGRRGCGSHHR